jgi:hypothetical protein
LRLRVLVDADDRPALPADVQRAAAMRRRATRDRLT